MRSTHESGRKISVAAGVFPGVVESVAMRCGRSLCLRRCAGASHPSSNDGTGQAGCDASGCGCLPPVKRFVRILMTLGFAISAAKGADYLREVKPVLMAHCYRCHGASQQKGGLRVDTAAGLLRGGEHGPAVKPGDVAGSLVLRVVRGAHESIPSMPYKKPPLADGELAALMRWVSAGAQAPADEAPERVLHWAFVPPKRRPLPAVAGEVSVSHPVDAFIRARLAQDGIASSPEADRATLLRRLCLDLAGLPPSVEEVDAFVRDAAPGAWERQVERLLASPHYGERWGRWWLDAARYADSNGYSVDAPRSIWKFRDWVIGALNRDLSFVEFTVDQLAGDLVPGATMDQRIATGFHRNTQINQEGGIDPEQFRVESVMDRVNTTATVWLGVTFGCAQCHDHKFDPFTQREYYRMYAFFNSSIEDGHGKGAPEGMLEIPDERGSSEDSRRQLAEAEADLERYLNTKGSAVSGWASGLTVEERGGLKPAVRRALAKPFAESSPKEKRLVYGAFANDDKEFKQRVDLLNRLEKGQGTTTLVMRELAEPRQTRVFTKGDFTRPAAAVTPGVPAILPPLNEHSTNTPANRLDLARWLVQTNNPLTARVIVNRVWQQYFGRGLVETENDFGTQGTPPTHPELLDWLASEFMEPTWAGISPAGAAPWSLKHVHRLIVTSAAYRQSSRARPDLAVVDPNNRSLARQSRLRLDAEVVRDIGLVAGGLMNPQIGGPSVFPPQPDGVMNLGQSRREWQPSAGVNRYRRGLYTFLWRATPHPALAVFDAADGFSACTRRVRSNTPLQALTLLNDEAFVEFARGLGERGRAFARLPEKGDVDGLERMFRLCVARRPEASEIALLRDVLKRGRLVGESAAWTLTGRVLLNLDETITRE